MSSILNLTGRGVTTELRQTHLVKINTFGIYVNVRLYQQGNRHAKLGRGGIIRADRYEFLMTPYRSIWSELHCQLVLLPLVGCPQHEREIIRRRLDFQNAQWSILMIENLHGALATFALEKALKDNG